VLLVELLKSCGCLIEVKVDRLTKDMPSHAYLVTEKLSEDPNEIIDLVSLPTVYVPENYKWPKNFST
jgi:hypothetical protein